MIFAFVFPGQGSQAVGMLNSFAGINIVRETIEEASDALGKDLWRLIAEGPIDQLSLTVNTQPVMLASAYAIYRTWKKEGGRIPSLVVGHSLGEYTALVVSGAISFFEAVQLVRFRAEAMQSAVPNGEGAMAVIFGLDESAIKKISEEASNFGLVEPVNFNSPSQIVIAGIKRGVEKACEIARRNGARKTKFLPVSVPFHSSLLIAASERLKEYLKNIKINRPVVPFINNVDATIVNDPFLIQDLLVRQAAAPVRWVQCIHNLRKQGMELVIECGPNRIFTSLTRQILPELLSIAIYDPVSLRQSLAIVNQF